MNENKREPLTFVSLALALANDYSTLFVIDPLDDSYTEYTPDGESKELVPVTKGDNFYTDVRYNVPIQVWPEDQKMFLDTFKKESVTGALDAGTSFTLSYRLKIDGEPRYFFLKTIRSSDRSIIIGVRDIDAEKRRELAAASEKITYSEIAGSLASLFEVIYHIDIETGRYSQYMSSPSYDQLGFSREGEDFFTVLIEDANKVIHPEDRSEVMSRLDKSALLSELRRTGSLSVTYRQILDGRTQWLNLLAFLQKNDAEHLVVGVRNIDQQIRQQNESLTYAHIAEALASRYEAIYYIDTETNGYTVYSYSDDYAALGTTKSGRNFFADAADDIRLYIHVHDIPRMLEEITKENLLTRLENDSSLAFTYRQLLNGDYQYMNMIVVRPKNDMHHIVLGVFNVDAQTRHIKNMEQRTRTFSDISLALAMQYEVIYHVDLSTNEYSEYSASEKYSRLKVGATGEDFFADTAVNMARDIYPEDYPMMREAMKKENLLRRMEETGKTFLNYRLIIDGRPQYVSLYAVRAEKDSDHIIIAVANVDKAKRMELNYRSAMDLANRDALTGVKNKRAYAQAEMELDEQISQQLMCPFAIVICDLNGLKEVNDTLGHKAGDDFIKSGCAVICDVFDHSPVFRIGGDEFAVIVRDRDYERRESLIDEFFRIRERHLSQGLVTIACGISDYRPETDLRLQDVFERADSRMYEDKKQFKNR